MIRLQLDNHGIRVQFPLRVQGCLHNSAQTGCETLQVSFAIGSRFFSCSKVAGGVYLITHLHVLRLSMWGDIPLPLVVTSWHGV